MKSAHAEIGNRKYVRQADGMGKQLRFNPKFRGDKMPVNSLVNFGKVYSIERDVPVIEYGKVDRDQSQSLLTTLERRAPTMKVSLSEEERQRHQVEDRNRWEDNQDSFAGD